MALIVTPGQFSQRAEFYHQLGQLTSAGLGLVRALEQLKRNPPARSYRQPIQRLLDELASGFTLTESLQRLGHWLPAFDIALAQAGEQSGRLDACFRLLADYYTDRARMARLTQLLRQVETDEEPSPEVRQLRIAAANEWRAAHGIPPLREDDEPRVSLGGPADG